jgi:hypothetical protein
MKAFFLGRQFREKLILIALLAIGSAWWGSALYGAARKFQADEATQKAARAKQLEVLNREAQILAAQHKLIEKLDPVRTVDSTDELLLAVDRIAKAHPGIGTIGSSQPKVSRGAQLTMITQQVTMNNVKPDMNDLVEVYRDFARLAPYVTIVESSIRLLGNTNTRGGGRGGATDFANPAATSGLTATTRGGGRGGAATTTAGMIGTEAAGGGGRGGRGGAATTTGLATTGGARANTGPRLNVSFTLNAISISKPGATRPTAAPAAPAPARATTAAPRPAT